MANRYRSTAALHNFLIVVSRAVTTHAERNQNLSPHLLIFLAVEGRPSLTLNTCKLLVDMSAFAADSPVGAALAKVEGCADAAGAAALSAELNALISKEGVKTLFQVRTVPKNLGKFSALQPDLILPS